MSTYTNLHMANEIGAIDAIAKGVSHKKQGLKFHPLTLAQVDVECQDAMSLSFDIPKQLSRTFEYIAGQHLTLRTMIDGEEIRRSYSICSEPNSRYLRVAIKQVEGGLFSNFAKQHFKKGMVLDVMPPLGNFFTPLVATQAKHYVAIIAGSGITPIISLISHTLAIEPLSKFTLLYGNKKRSHILFADVLDHLKNTYQDRLSIHHFLTQEPSEIDFFNGRLNADKLVVAYEQLISPLKIDEVFICGPNEMIDVAMSAMQQCGVSDSHIHFERFGVPVDDNLKKQDITQNMAVDENNSSNQSSAYATVILDGITRRFEVSPNQTLLEASIKAGLDLPYSCRGGVCCTCRAKVLEGEVSMIKNYALGKDEVAEGYVLTCQSVPQSAEVRVSFDE